MIRTITIASFLLLFALLYSTHAYADTRLSGNPTRFPTCQAFQTSAPHDSSIVYSIGDSIMTRQGIQDTITAGVEDTGGTVNKYYAQSGLRVHNAVSQLEEDAEHVRNATIIVTNLGVNNWLYGNDTQRAQLQEFIDKVTELNPTAIIVWQEPYAQPGHNREDRVEGSTRVRAHLRSFDQSGVICLVPWADYAEANPDVYDSTPCSSTTDGVHIYCDDDMQAYGGYVVDILRVLTQDDIPNPTVTNPAGCGPIGDIDCSGEVNIFDLSILLRNFGTTDNEGDLDSSGEVNIFDLSTLLTNFGL